MSNTPGGGPHPQPPSSPTWDELFTVPVPQSIGSPQLPSPGANPTQVIPVAPTPTVNPYGPDPYAAQPGWATAGADEASPDPLLASIGIALFWITVGWWLFVLVRVIGHVVRFGVTDTLLIRTIDRGGEETVVAAVVSVFAALLLLFGRGRSGRDALGWCAAGLALVTVAVAVWRVLP